jgi:hypothetical protein
MCIGDRLAEREQQLRRLEAAAERERLDCAMERTMESLRSDLPDDDASIRRAALRELDRMEEQREEQSSAIKDAEAKVQEWDPEPNGLADLGVGVALALELEGADLPRLQLPQRLGALAQPLVLLRLVVRDRLRVPR